MVDLPDVESLGDALRARGLLPAGGRVTRVEDVGLAGRGLVGEVRRLLVHRTAGAPIPAVLKTSTAESAGAAAVEREFYRLTPGLSMPTPALLHDDVLLLEDLGDNGFVRQVDGCTPSQAERALGAVASLHAECRDLSPAWLRSSDDSWPAVFCRRELTSWDGRWPSVLGEVPALLAARFDRIADALDTPDRTLVHGDFHSQNVHFGPEQCTLIDFQFAHRASGALDVARLLGTSLTTGTRRAVEHDLLAAYERASGTPVDRDALRAGLLWNLTTPLALHLRAMRAHGRDWPPRLPILERCLAAARDWDAPALLG